MILPDVRTAIFREVPKEIEVGTETYTVYVEYAHLADVTALLGANPIVVTLRYWGDRPADETNGLFARDTSGDDIVYTRGERTQDTLSINIHARDDPAATAEDLILAYLAALEIWILRDLPAVIDVAGRSPVSDLSYLEEGTQRRQIDVYLGSAVTYTETIPSIDTVDADLEVE